MEIGQQADARILPAAADAMRLAIAEVGGREVFFAGRLTSEGMVSEARVCARGHEGAVPAVLDGLDMRDVVIHNHPSGGIAPSEADLQLASIFGFNGHGVYIVDNEVARVYVVVEPFVDKQRYRLEGVKLDQLLSPAGPVARKLQQYEVRPQQHEMMEAVARAFNEEEIAVVEAPTGVGKTVAYLLPAILWATGNRERVVVSTRTINLQEQIISKDIPLIQKSLDVKFSAVLVKGRGNYLCRRKLERAVSEAMLFEDEGDEAALKAISEWAEKTEGGSLSELAFVPRREVWERVCSDADTCQFAACPHFKVCFMTKARRDVAKADIIVTNNHMLFSDLAIKKEVGNFSTLAVLPAYHRVIFDEAHNVEDSATEYFGAEITRNGVMMSLGRMIRAERGRERGLVAYLKVKLQRYIGGVGANAINEILDFIDMTLLPAIGSTREAVQVACEALRSLTAERCGQIGRDIKWRLTEAVLKDEALREIHTVYVLPAVEEMMACGKAAIGCHDRVRKLPKPCEEVEPPFMMEAMELKACGERLQRMANVLAEGTSEELAPNTVRWIEIDAKKPHIVRVVRCPLDVGEPMSEWVFPNLKTVAMTSATLSVRGSFDYLNNRIGLDRTKGKTIQAKALDSPFNFKKQAILCIPTDIAPPTDKSFLDETVEHIRRTIAITRGHAFILFTSFYALDYAYKRLEGEFRQAGIAPLKQGEVARTQLLDRFRSDASSVLFGTDSFWEGVDVAGEALQCVILPKLPFRVPTEPIQEARAEAIDAAGGNSFMEYTVPQAVIKFRQGFGRLVRRKTDRGAIVVLDHRVVTKYYGKVFLESLPEMRVVKGPSETVYGSLSEFFSQMKGNGQ